MEQQPLAANSGADSAEAQHLIQDAIAERQARLQRFRGPVEQHDAQVIERWRDAPASAHACAMIDLARYAEQMVAQTGFGKDPKEMFPGFPPGSSAGPAT